MESSNPALSGDWGRRPAQRYATFRDVSPADLQRAYDAPAYVPVHERVMTVDSVVLRTAAMLAVLALAGAATWVALPAALFGPVVLVSAIAGLVLALVIVFKQVTNPAAVLSYAALEGVVLGAISKLYESAYGGIVLQAVVATAAVFAGMVVVYRAKLIRATPRFAKVLTGALFGVLGLMIANALVGWIGGGSGLGLRSGGTLSIVFSLVVIVIAALTFILDFDQVERAVAAGVPERFAWYAAFGIVVGLVWLYLEILRLLGYLRR